MWLSICKVTQCDTERRKTEVEQLWGWMEHLERCQFSRVPLGSPPPTRTNSGSINSPLPRKEHQEAQRQNTWTSWGQMAGCCDFIEIKTNKKNPTKQHWSKTKTRLFGGEGMTVFGEELALEALESWDDAFHFGWSQNIVFENCLQI